MKFDGERVRLEVLLFVVQSLLYDSLVLNAVFLLIDKKPSFLRMLFALSVSLLVGGFAFLHVQFMLPLVPLLVVKLAFGCQSKRQYLKGIVYFYVLSSVLSGIMHMLRYFVRFDFSSVLLYVGVSVLIGFVVVLVYVVKMRYLASVSALSKFVHEVRFFCGKLEVTGVGFVDTGNELIDSKTLNPVMIVPRSKIPKSSVDDFLRECNVATWDVSYSVIDDSSRYLVAFKPTLLMIDDKVVKDVVIGLCDMPFRKYDFLLQPSIVGNV